MEDGSKLKNRRIHGGQDRGEIFIFQLQKYFYPFLSAFQSPAVLCPAGDSQRDDFHTVLNAI
ncbi:hypothetical protein NQZ68_023695 [Dissostichus eleginoides]|nr:hypothetical protein NQZ68_023695 [Dissostichus eleginoides]